MSNPIKMSAGLAVVVLALAINVVSVQPATARDWTCDATVALTGTSYSYALPVWSMSGGPAVDREKKCKEHIDAWMKTGEIWHKLGIPASDQDRICHSGGAFRIDYGFDTRKKDWNFQWSGKPPCKCAGPMSFQ